MSDDAAKLPPRDPAPAGARKQPRAARREQLIEATIEVLAERGFARTTLADVARRAGLAVGLINFHFTSKEALLDATLAYLAEEYRRHWHEAFAAAGPDPAAQLLALMRVDFDPALATRARLGAWVSFWGEAQSRPRYQALYGENDEGYMRRNEALCAALLARRGASGDPVRIARVLRATTEGIWMDLVTMAEPYPLAEGLETVLTAAAAFFGQDFGPESSRATGTVRRV